jgi:hypothetical protein
VRSHVLRSQGGPDVDLTLRRAALTYKGTLRDFFQLSLATDDNQHSLAFVQYQWATSRAGKTGDIDATL